MKNRKVQVLMSTYNGEKYISKQLNSIVNQDMPLSLLIRDDGSSDTTLDIIEKYEKKYKFISHTACENIGVIHSFFELFKMADKDADYYALADQDDIWFKDKISRAVDIMEQYPDDVPVLYCAAQKLIDADDNVLHVSMRKVDIKPGFGNAVVENIATGCTCIFNKKMLSLVSEYEPEYTIMHDWWLYMIASSMGIIHYDERPCMYYRQHGNNTMGSRTNYIDEFKERVLRYTGNRGKLYRQMKAFAEKYRLSGENADIINLVMNYRKSIGKRLKCIFSRKIYRQRLGDNIIFKLLFFTNHI